MGYGMRRLGRGARHLTWVVGLAWLAGLAGAARNEDSWDAVYLAGSKVGYVHTFIEPVKDRGRDLLRIRIVTELNYRRLNDPVTIRFEYGTIETLDGQILRL